MADEQEADAGHADNVNGYSKSEWWVGYKNLCSTFYHVLFLIKIQTIAVKLDVSIIKPNVFLKNPRCFLRGQLS